MNYITTGAQLSDCRTYRYRLWREWTVGTGTVVFIGLNPSTADESVDDLTARRCVSYARDWGYSRLMMVNLFAWCSTDPGNLPRAADPAGPENDMHLVTECRTADLVVAAWGNLSFGRERETEVLNLLNQHGIRLHCLGMTTRGYPLHPSRQRRDLRPVIFRR